MTYKRPHAATWQAQGGGDMGSDVRHWEEREQATHIDPAGLAPLPDPPSSLTISELAGWYQTVVVKTVARTYSQDESGSYIRPLPDPSGLRYRGSTHGTLGHNS